MNANIDIKKIMKENQTAVLIISAALIMLFVYSIVFAPVANKMRLKYQECRACEVQVADARNLIEMGYKIDKEYGGKTLISEQQAAIGIEEFTRYGKSLGINFISIKPQGVIKQENTSDKILPLELLLEASGEQFVEFIGSIDELKRAIVTVKSFDITPDKDDRNKLKVNTVINVYLSLEAGNPEEM
ncbi:MAG: type 4a pilus biogenesis protein PilO [Candidatus Omnitrophota bacterium]|nr:type 4a pilus biogenesis protein PilO [Candidatus Omnitrophota bacterium]